MDNQELREKKKELGLSDCKINYKTGIRLPVIEDFFSGKCDPLELCDREKIEALILAKTKSTES